MKKKFTLFNIIFLYEFFLVNIIQHHRFAQIFGTRFDTPIFWLFFK